MSKRSGRYYRRYPWKRQNGRTRTWVHQSDSNAMCHWITGITLKWLWRPDFLYPKSEWETHASGSIDDNSILRIYTGTSHFIAKSLIFVSFAFFFWSLSGDMKPKPAICAYRVAKMFTNYWLDYTKTETATIKRPWIFAIENDRQRLFSPIYDF